MAKTMRQWLESGAYLPKRFRDFHEQKNLFKLVWRQVLVAQERAKQEGAPFGPFDGQFSWVMAHCFTIDQFLWFMAKHGWTLQRARAPEGVQFLDLDDALEAYQQQTAEVLKQEFKR